jgi:hypothetical protein
MNQQSDNKSDRISISALSRRSGADRETVRKWLNGGIVTPRMHGRLAAAFVDMGGAVAGFDHQLTTADELRSRVWEAVQKAIKPRPKKARVDAVLRGDLRDEQIEKIAASVLSESDRAILDQYFGYWTK